MTEKILIRSPAEIKEMMLKQANKRGLTMNSMILTILWEWLQAQEAKRHDG